MGNLRIRGNWLGALLGVGLCSGTFCAAADLADRIPDTAVITAEWHQIGGDGTLVNAVRAILDSPVVKADSDRDMVDFRQFLTFVDLASRKSGIVAVMPGNEGGPAELACVVDGGSEIGQLEATLKQALRSGDEVRQPQAVTINDVSFTAYGSERDAMHVGVQDHYLLLSWGKHAAETLAGAGTFKPLSQDPEYAAVHQKFKPQSEWRASVYANIQSGLQMLGARKSAAGPEALQVMDALGVEQFKALFIQFDGSDIGPRMVSYLHCPKADGSLAQLWRQSAVTDADVALIPRDAYWANVSKFDLAALYREGLTVAEKLEPTAPATVEGVMSGVRQMLGYSPSTDLLPVFGDTWQIYDAPDHGGLLVTGMVLVNNVRDADALQGMLQRTVDYFAPLAAQGNVKLTLKEMKQGGHVIHYLLIGGVPVPIAPAWTFVDKHWAFALAPQTLAAALPQLDPASRRSSLLDNSDYKAARAKLPKALTSVHYADAQNANRLWYPLTLLVATAAASGTAGSDHPFDLAAVPNFRDFTAGLHNLVSGSSFDAEGLVSTTYGATPGTMLISGNADIVTLATMTSVLLPSLSRARELAKRTVCMSNIRGVGMGCWIYANDHKDEFPKELNELVKLGMVTPAQFVCPSAGTTEQDAENYLNGRGSVGWTYISGQNSRSDVRNVLMFESLSHHDGEGGGVLFIDSHVQFMKPAELREAVVETYKRLNRESEIPAKFRD